MGSDLKAIYRFSDFTLDLVRGALISVDGVEAALRPKSFSFLHYMVVHAGRLIDRDELMRAVWPGVLVTDDSIAQCVKDVRRALGDDAQSLLRTVPRRGFLLAVSASRIAAGEFGNPLYSPPTTEATEPLPAPATNRPIIVVLPFENVGGDPEQGYLASGMTADLVTDLTRFQDLHVVSPVGYTTGFLASNTSSPGWTLPDAATYVVSGRVRRAGGRIGITVRLDDAGTGVSLWAERIERPLADLFTLQEELTERLPNRLVSQVELESIRRARRRPTDSLGRMISACKAVKCTLG